MNLPSWYSNWNSHSQSSHSLCPQQSTTNKPFLKVHTACMQGRFFIVIVVKSTNMADQKSNTQLRLSYAHLIGNKLCLRNSQASVLYFVFLPLQTFRSVVIRWFVLILQSLIWTWREACAVYPTGNLAVKSVQLLNKMRPLLLVSRV